MSDGASNNAISALTELALVANSTSREPVPFGQPWPSFGDPFMEHLSSIHFHGLATHGTFVRAREELLSDPDLKPFAPMPDELDPMVLSAMGGGARQDFDGLLTALLSNAARYLAVQDVDQTDSAFVRAVLENYDEMKRAARGEKVRSYTVRGLTGVSLEAGVHVTTPWGVVRGINRERFPPRPFMGSPQPEATALLVSPQLMHVTITRDPEPGFVEVDQGLIDEMQRVRVLLPLLFALTCTDQEQLAAPFVTFETVILPLIGGTGYSSAIASNPFMPSRAVSHGDVKEIEGLATVLQDLHHDSLQIAALRIVSAISQRHDKADALIDAVTSWESLVGTRNETVYRVTAALTNLLEPNPAARSAFRKDLGKVYDTRSRVVHGDAVDPSTIAEAADKAIRVALAAIRELYAREGEWLSLKSEVRSERLILGS